MKNYDTIFSNLYNIAFNSIDCKGLETISPLIPKRAIKKLVIEKGKFCVYNDMILDFAPSGTLNIYGESSTYNLFGANGTLFSSIPYNKVKTIYASGSAKPLITFIRGRSEILANIDTAINNNVNAVNLKKLLVVNDSKVEKNLISAIKKYLQGDIAVVANNAVMQDISTIDLSIDFNASQLFELYTAIETDTLNKLGISDTLSSKRERVQTAEISANLSTAYDNVNIIIDSINSDLRDNDINDFYFFVNSTIGQIFDNLVEEQEVNDNVSRETNDGDGSDEK